MKIRKTLAIICALLSVITLVSCSSNTVTPTGSAEPAPAVNPATEPLETIPAAENPAGEMKQSGIFKIFVPEGMELSPGTMFNETDPEALSMYDNNNFMHFYMLSTYDDIESVQSNVDMTRDVNPEYDLTDVSMTTGENKWEGVKYTVNDMTNYVIYTEIGGKYVQITGSSTAIDDDVTKAVLESIEIVAAN